MLSEQSCCRGVLPEQLFSTGALEPLLQQCGKRQCSTVQRSAGSTMQHSAVHSLSCPLLYYPAGLPVCWPAWAVCLSVCAFN